MKYSEMAASERLRTRMGRHKAIAAYAAEMAGTRFELDPDLEAAATDQLIESAGLKAGPQTQRQTGLRPEQ
jgi:hypothetical protein